MKVRQNDVGDYMCEHGTAMDVHCCNCHHGFLFDASQCVCSFDDDPRTVDEICDEGFNLFQVEPPRDEDR